MPDGTPTRMNIGSDPSPPLSRVRGRGEAACRGAPWDRRSGVQWTPWKGGRGRGWVALPGVIFEGARGPATSSVIPTEASLRAERRDLGLAQSNPRDPSTRSQSLP